MIRPIQPEELASLLDRGTDPELPEGRIHVFDVRDAKAFTEAHVPTARHVPEHQAMRWIPQWIAPYELVVLVDADGKSGGTARHVAHELAHQWFRRLRYVVGGMNAWRDKELRIEQGGVAGASSASADGSKPDFLRSSAVKWRVPEKPLTPDPQREDPLARFGDTVESSD